ncbi:MAG: hypothetical protein JRJ79_08465 [Deltaproteobacteria bacterium]|nr:hypothetical protein [Deltaproteobacteria bacterium]
MRINIGIEFEYLLIYLELKAFKEFLDRLEKGLEYITKQETLYSPSIIHGLTDPNDIQIAENEHKEFINRIMPRFFRNPALVSLWAIYESSVNKIADHLHQKLSEDLPQLKNYLKNRKMNFLHRANKYFHDVLKIPLYSNGHEDHLERLMVLRHAIAHCNGRLEEVKNKKRQRKIREWVKGNIGISIYHGDLIISESFLREIFLIIEESLHFLIKSANSTFN